MFERILVAYDGSDFAKKALTYAVGLQKLTGSELLILTVFRHHSQMEASMSMVRAVSPDRIDDTLGEFAKTQAGEAKAIALQEGADKVRAFVKNGQPARTIVKFAEQHEVGLIVLGSRGIGDLEGYLLGSVSHKVTSLAKCPVLVV